MVNCSGLGARLLADDRTVVPVRGQVVCVEQTGLGTWWVDPEANTYVFPRSKDIVVGGTDDEGEWSRTPSPETARARSCERAEGLVPEIRGARVVRHKVGLRPVRPAVRLERERRRHPLLRARRRGRHPQLGRGRRGGVAGG